jgi:hypothetical protein
MKPMHTSASSQLQSCLLRSGLLRPDLVRPGLVRAGLLRLVAMLLGLAALVCSGPLTARGQSALEPAQAAAAQASGSIRGSVVDPSGSAVAGARVRLALEGQVLEPETVTGESGEFLFADVAPGKFKLAITAEGFAERVASGVLQPGDVYVMPQMALMIARATAEMRVTPTQVDVAEDQIKVEEKQRLLGVVPNFYVSYAQHAAPLTSKQKFELAWKATIDPVTFGVNGVIAGVQQAQDDFNGYGQGAAGYGRRYGASYANFLTGTYIGGAILPSLLKQDPRYFYKGTGSARSRVMYALANAVICKGDDGTWQANYSGIIGSLASGAISNLYYPAKDREGLSLTFENALINIGATAATNILQEFVFRKLTPGSRHDAAKPQSVIDVPPAAPSGLAQEHVPGDLVYGTSLGLK